MTSSRNIHADNIKQLPGVSAICDVAVSMEIVAVFALGVTVVCLAAVSMEIVAVFARGVTVVCLIAVSAVPTSRRSRAVELLLNAWPFPPLHTCHPACL